MSDMPEEEYVDDFRLSQFSLGDPTYPAVAVGTVSRLVQIHDDGKHVGTLVSDPTNNSLNYMGFSESAVGPLIQQKLRENFAANIPAQFAIEFIAEELEQLGQYSYEAFFGVAPDYFADSDSDVEYAFLVSGDAIVTAVRNSPSSELYWDEGEWVAGFAGDDLEFVEATYEEVKQFKTLEAGTSLTEIKEEETDDE